MTYELKPTQTFIKKAHKLTKNNAILKKDIKKVLDLLEDNPFYPSLHPHKADTQNFGIRWSSWVTGDIRIIWDFDEDDRIIILLLDIGKHSGKHKVYK